MSLIAGGAVIALFFFFYWQRETSLSLSQNKPDEDTLLEVLYASLPQLEQRWHEGDREGFFSSGEVKCPTEWLASPSFHAEYLRCNRHYLQCFFSHGIKGLTGTFPIKLAGQTYEVTAVPVESNPAHFTQVITKAGHNAEGMPALGVKVTLTVKGSDTKLAVVLADTCRDAYLPQRHYSYGPKESDPSSQSEMLWDNVGRHLFIDRFPVSVNDINDWIVSAAPAGLVLNEKVSQWPSPAMGLTAIQQESYCAWRGARRLEAHLFDAATFLPSDIERPYPDVIFKSQTPWGRDWQDTFFAKVKLSADARPSVLDCQRAFVQECEGRFPWRTHDPAAPSWMGISQIMGGEMEAFRNPYEPLKNLKLSSRYLSVTSPHHQLALRGGWKGEGIERDDFILPEDVLFPAKGTTFRCYREVTP